MSYPEGAMFDSRNPDDGPQEAVRTMYCEECDLEEDQTVYLSGNVIAWTCPNCDRENEFELDPYE